MGNCPYCERSLDVCSCEPCDCGCHMPGEQICDECDASQVCWLGRYQQATPRHAAHDAEDVVTLSHSVLAWHYDLRTVCDVHPSGHTTEDIGLSFARAVQLIARLPEFRNPAIYTMVSCDLPGSHPAHDVDLDYYVLMNTCAAREWPWASYCGRPKDGYVEPHNAPIGA